MRQPFTLKSVAQTAAEGRDAAKTSGLAHAFAGMAVQGVLFFGIESAMLLLRDRRLGIWRRLRASPVGQGELLVGKALSSALIGGFVLCAVLGFGMLVFGIRVAGSWIGLGATVVATSLMVASFGLLVAALGRTEQQSRGLSVMAVLLMVMLGGAWFPSSLMPEWVQKLSLIMPVRWSLDGFDAMMWRGGGLSEALAPIAGLLFFTAVFSAVAAFRFRTMPETA
jgi:ABC-2 type transport system permease protein